MAAVVTVIEVGNAPKADIERPGLKCREVPTADNALQQIRRRFRPSQAGSGGAGSSLCYPIYDADRSGTLRQRQARPLGAAQAIVALRRRIISGIEASGS